MRFTSWLLLLLCFAALGLVGGLLYTGGEKTPKELLTSAKSRVQGKRTPDTQGALRDLDWALKLALEEKPEPDKRLVADILLVRGFLLKGLSALTPARNDFQAILDHWRPGDADVELQLIDLDQRGGELEKALERATALTQREPDRVEGWARRGLIQIELCDRMLEQCDELLRGVMAEDQALEAYELVLRVTAMDFSEPRRVAVLHDLKGYFEPIEEAEARELLRLCDIAERGIADARVSLVQAMRGQLSTPVMLAYLQLLHRAGRLQEAADFGQCAMLFPAASGSRPFALELMKILMALGRPEIGVNLIDRYFARGVSPDEDFFSTWCRALYDSENWRSLTYIAGQWKGWAVEQDQPIPNFYVGIGLAEDKQCGQALLALSRYLQRKPVEPFPGALARAWRAQAHCARTQGELFNEKPSLLETLRLDPDGNGDDWLRLAEILRQTEPESIDKIEDALTHAIRLLPEQRDELMSLWAEAGETTMRAAGVEIDLLFDDLAAQGLSTPSGLIGAFEIWRLAEMHRDAGNDVLAMAACKRLLDRYPGFLPAVDLYAELALRIGNDDLAAELFLEHLRVAGPDMVILDQLAALPDGTLSSQQLLELVEIDPEHTGRMLVAETLREEGRAADALNGIFAQDTDPLGDAGRLLIGGLYSDLEQYGPALDALTAIKPGSELFGAAVPIALRAAVAQRDSERLDLWIERVANASALDVHGVVRGADMLLAQGFVNQAGQLCSAADLNESGRSSAMLARLAQVGMLAGDRVLAEESLDRAAAFDDSGRAEFGRILLAIGDRAWSGTPFLVRDLQRTRARQSPLADACLALLDERLDESDRALTELVRADPENSLALLAQASLALMRGADPATIAPCGLDNQTESLIALRGPTGTERDPRGVLAMLLALENPDWRAWMVALLASTPLDQPGSMWPVYLAARGALSLGNVAQAESLLKRLVAAHSKFEPAWDLYETVIERRLQTFDDIRLARLREARRTALGNPTSSPAEALLVRAFDLEAQGDSAGAIRAAKAALDADPRFLPALVKLGALESMAGQWQDAISAYAQACSLVPEASAAPVVGAFVELLERAAALAPNEAPASLRQLRLEAVHRRFPRDPLVALELAKLDLAVSGTAPAIGVARAYDRLERFRTGTLGAPIDSLRPGAARRWRDFYAALDLVRAERFVRGELEQRPGSLETWLMLGEVLAQRGRPDEAIELYELASRMVPEGQTRRAIASLLAVQGEDLARVQGSIDEVMRLERMEQPDVDLEFTLARALAAAGAGTREQAVEVLERLWSEKERATSRTSAADIGQFLGTTLVQRSRAQDRLKANEILATTSGSVADVQRKILLRALSYLALQVPGPALAQK